MSPKNVRCPPKTVAIKLGGHITCDKNFRLLCIMAVLYLPATPSILNLLCYNESR